MIRTAVPSDNPAIAALLHEAFGDAPEYIEMFMENRMEHENTLLCFKDNQLAAQLFILPCELVFEEKSYKCGYIYAVATAKVFRKQGISSKLLKHCHELLLSRGYDAAVLVPSSKSLAEFYLKRGYSPQGYICIKEIGFGTVPQKSSQITLTPISETELLSLRRKWFGSAYLHWDSRAISYIVRETHFLKGEFYHFTWENVDCFTSCIPYDKDTLLIKELACPKNAATSLLTALGAAYNKKNFILRLSPELFPSTKTLPAGMCHWLIDNPPNNKFYLSHFLD